VKSGRITLQGHLFKALVGIPGTGSRPMLQLRCIGNNPPIPNDFDLGFVFFDDSEFHAKYSTVECLWVDPGIVEDEDLDARYTGGFGLALSPHSNTEAEVFYTRVGFVQFSSASALSKLVGKVKLSKLSIV
jgi:hypothetical protein